MSWQAPSRTSLDYLALREACNQRHLRLHAAVTPRDAVAIGGDYAIYCKFSRTQLIAADTLRELAEWMRLGGDL
jgi:hypothetical protein